MKASTQSSKVQIKIRGNVECSNLPMIVKDKISEDLTFQNQQYQNATNYGGYAPQNISEFIDFYDVSEDEEILWVPRGYIFYLIKFLKQNDIPFNIIDQTIKFDKMDIKFHGTLRDYQNEAVFYTLSRYPVGVIEAATGSGKTVTAIGVIAQRKQPTLIVVHTKELLYQWQEAIKKFLDYDCGLIGDGKFKVEQISVGIINTIKNKVDLLKDKFGQIVIDECHRCPSNVWTSTIQEFPARYYLGLSATAFRRDGLGKAIFYHLGPRVHEVDKTMLQDTGAVLKPSIRLIMTKFRAARSFMDEEQMSYSTVIKKLTEDYDRNKLITYTIYNDLKEFKENVIVVSDRVKHLSEISNMLKSVKVKNRILSGKTGTKKRKEIVEEVRNGKCKVLLATISLVGEGFDVPDLSALFLTTPVKFKGRLVQIVGRILRPKDKKVPRLYDFRDDNVRTLQYSGYARNKIYKKEGWG